MGKNPFRTEAWEVCNAEMCHCLNFGHGGMLAKVSREPGKLSQTYWLTSMANVIPDMAEN